MRDLGCNTGHTYQPEGTAKGFTVPSVQMEIVWYFQLDSTARLGGKYSEELLQGMREGTDVSEGWGQSLAGGSPSYRCTADFEREESIWDVETVRMMTACSSNEAVWP